MSVNSTCERMRAARDHLGLTPEQVARAMGISAPWYYDLEAYPADIFSTVSLAQLWALGKILGLEPAGILTGGAPPLASGKHFRDIVDGLERRMKSEAIDADALGTLLGWDIRAVLAEPEKPWEFSVTGLQDVCMGVGIDWLSVLPRLP